MRHYFLLLTICTFSLWCAAQTTAPASPAGPTTSTSAVKILEPKAGAKLTTDFVQLSYALENASVASGTSDFSLATGCA